MSSSLLFSIFFQCDYPSYNFNRFRDAFNIMVSPLHNLWIIFNAPHHALVSLFRSLACFFFFSFVGFNLPALSIKFSIFNQFFFFVCKYFMIGIYEIIKLVFFLLLYVQALCDVFCNWRVFVFVYKPYYVGFISLYTY